MSDQSKVVFHHDINDIAELAPSWAALAASKDQPHFFQTPGWLAHVAAIRAKHSARDWRPCLASLWRDGALKALWPLAMQREGLTWIARSLDDPFGQFAGVPVAEDQDPDRAIETIIDALKTKGLVAGLVIEQVPGDTALHRCLSAQGGKIAYADEAAIVDFRPFATYEAYLKTRKPKTRKNLRNAQNRLKRDHDFEHEIVTSDGDLRGLIDQAFEHRLIWLQDQAKTAPAFRDPDFRRLLSGLSEAPFKDSLIGFRLKTASGEIISLQWGFVHAGRYYAFISARNPAFDLYSPGRLHLGMVLEACFERGIEVVELLAPASEYKLNWTSDVRRVDDFGLAFTAGGYLYLDLWRRHGRSMARRLYHSLPDGLRRHVAERANRSLAS